MEKKNSSFPSTALAPIFRSLAGSAKPCASISCALESRWGPFAPDFLSFPPLAGVLLGAEAQMGVKGGFVCDWPVWTILDLHSC